MNTDKFVPQNTRDNYPEQAREIVRNYYNAYIADIASDTARHLVSLDQVYMVSGMKTLQHWKGTFGTTNTDGLFFEVTFNGDKGEIYIDQYLKVQQLVIKGDQPFQVYNFPEYLRQHHH